MFKANFSGPLKIEDMCKRGKHQALSGLYSWSTIIFLWTQTATSWH